MVSPCNIGTGTFRRVRAAVRYMPAGVGSQHRWKRLSTLLLASGVPVPGAPCVVRVAVSSGERHRRLTRNTLTCAPLCPVVTVLIVREGAATFTLHATVDTRS